MKKYVLADGEKEREAFKVQGGLEVGQHPLRGATEETNKEIKVKIILNIHQLKQNRMFGLEVSFSLCGARFGCHVVGDVKAVFDISGPAF